MADAFLGLAELLKIDDTGLADYGVTDLIDDAPFLKALAAVLSSDGTNHKYLKETSAPVVGFRPVNDGRENAKSGDTLVEIALKILDASFGVDMALADAHKKGPDAFVMREAVRHLKAAFFHAEKQLVYGADSDGFSGLVSASTLQYTDSGKVLNALGDTANETTSVYLVRTNEEGDAAVVMGNDGNIEIGQTVVQRASGATAGTYPEYYTPISGWMGLQVGSAHSIVRIANIDFDHPLTDDLIYEAVSMFPAGRKPNLCVMNGTARNMLRKSRTATNATGAPAPIPEEVAGAEIVETDAIVDTEAVTGADPG
ncbi:major capsid protein [Paremcibacter congregatus]|uniref:major capsid protein n=1 Tax=Paremcibacter congregatus TaxID=2043170 RepID=UPI003A8F15D0